MPAGASENARRTTVYRVWRTGGRGEIARRRKRLLVGSVVCAEGTKNKKTSGCCCSARDPPPAPRPPRAGDSQLQSPVRAPVAVCRGSLSAAPTLRASPDHCACKHPRLLLRRKRLESEIEIPDSNDQRLGSSIALARISTLGFHTKWRSHFTGEKLGKRGKGSFHSPLNCLTTLT